MVSLVQRLAQRIDADDQEEVSGLNWGFGAFSGDALVPGLTIGSGKQETARAATGTAARREEALFGRVR